MLSYNTNKRSGFQIAVHKRLFVCISNCFHRRLHITTLAIFTLQSHDWITVSEYRLPVASCYCILKTRFVFNCNQKPVKEENDLTL